MWFGIFLFSSLATIVAYPNEKCKGDPHLGYSVQITSDAGKLIRRLYSSVSSSYCQQACCDSDVDCTVAVWHQMKRTCSLYSCPTEMSCDLMEQKDYVSYIIDSNYAAVDDENGGNLKQNKKGEEDDDEEDDMLTARRRATTPDLLRCTTDDDCVSVLRGAKCHAGECKCRFKWKNKDGVCHEPCTDKEWECGDLDSSDYSVKVKYSRCIAVYNRCDGIRNCADGSDELGCPGAGQLKRLPDRSEDTSPATSSAPVTFPPVTGDSNSTEVTPNSPGLASRILDRVGDILEEPSDAKAAIAAVVLASFVALIALFVVLCRVCRAHRLSFRRRRLVENVRRHGSRDVSKRNAKNLFSATEEEGDSLIPGSTGGNGMFLM